MRHPAIALAPSANLRGIDAPFPVRPWGAFKPRGIWAFVVDLMHLRIVRGALKKPIRNLLFARSPAYDVRIEGLKMRCHLGDNHTDNKVLAGRVDDFVRLITNGLRPGDTFVDIGANCELFTLFAARKVGPSGRVIAIEPSQPLLPRLHFNVDANGFDQVQIFASAVGDQIGTKPLYVMPTELGQSSLAPRPGFNRVDVPVKTLFSIVTYTGISRIDALKIDVESYEDRVLLPFLRDAPRTLWPRRILMEIVNAGFWEKDCISGLLAAGYQQQWASKRDILLVGPSNDRP